MSVRYSQKDGRKNRGEYDQPDTFNRGQIAEQIRHNHVSSLLHIRSSALHVPTLSSHPHLLTPQSSTISTRHISLLITMADVKVENSADAASSAPGPSYTTASMRPVELASTPTLPPPFGPSSAYAQTSQARNWRFSPSTLSRIRSEGNLAARRRLESLWNEETASTLLLLHDPLPFRR